MSGEPWGPAEDGVDRPYWEGLRAGELRLQRCTGCHAWIWGPQWICAHCHTFDPGWESVDAVGTVYTWSRSWYPFISELPVALPYVTVLVELPHAGNRRVLGILTDAGAGDTPRIGEAVTGHIELDEGATWPLLRWRRSATTGGQR
ncbi:Zn-ribbon domain-containing OB-fold protein [Nocardia sp. alder85J]|uniref:Zn-ribbon domain-containing OB-fold protein n=1 Tax=Nocardia sp. alder85J TaxID=2862949 RepID=UPI001CD1B5FE|nr:zinc ribbon domain-containing protein [Nocardia sp. alder85J]MCX4098457.1 zinc ribbon domain-containing protein [Nocardia sp. alder85J]